MKPRFTKAQLEEQVAVLARRVAELSDANAQLLARCACSDDLRSRTVDMFTKQVERAERRAVVPVYEWNPDVPGDFQRALAQAKEHNGRCQRMRVGVPR